MFFYHLQQRGCCNLKSVEEDDVMSYFRDKSGKLIHSASCCKSIRAVLKAGLDVEPFGCRKVLILLPHLTAHRKNIQVLTKDEITKIDVIITLFNCIVSTLVVCFFTNIYRDSDDSPQKIL